jgi:hypothetical protein
MAERLVTLPAKQVAWVRFPVPARPMFSVGKWLFSVTFSSTAIEIIKWVKKFAVAQAEGDPHLEVCEGVGEDTIRSYSAKSV